VGRFGSPVADPAGGTAGNVVATFVACGRVGPPARRFDDVTKVATPVADAGGPDVGTAVRADHQCGALGRGPSRRVPITETTLIPSIGVVSIVTRRAWRA